MYPGAPRRPGAAPGASGSPTAPSRPAAGASGAACWATILLSIGACVLTDRGGKMHSIRYL